jgi:7-cyano-7-deazaguanine synthase
VCIEKPPPFAGGSRISSLMPDSPWPPPNPAGPLAVLASGGLDSAVLLAEAARSYPAVHPLYVRVGSTWEEAELAHLRRFISRIGSAVVKSLVVLLLPVDDLYPEHWSLTGHDVPDEHTPDEAVYMPGRNVILLSKALLWCHLNGVPEIALAPLDSNPFPDATPEFFATLGESVNMAMGGAVRILRPYAWLSKTDVIRRGRGLPLDETFSCIRPVAGAHCGRCNKCAERQAAFTAAGIPDPTRYSDRRPIAKEKP